MLFRSSYARGAAFQSSSADKAHGSNGMAASLAGLESAVTVQDQEYALRRLLLLHGLALSFGALPVLYMGDELGMTNDYSYTQRADRAMDSRWLQRPAFDDSLLDWRHDGVSASGRLYLALRQLVGVRARLPALAADAPRRLLPAQSPAVLALLRGAGFLSLSNFSGAGQQYLLPPGEWRNCLDGSTVAGNIGLQPWQMLWLEQESQSPLEPS